MNYVSISFTHKNTDISTREKLSFSDDEKKRGILKFLLSNNDIKECMVLSTCNRIEILAFVKESKSAQKYILQSISTITRVDIKELEERADIYEDQGAIHHLFSVASSLDSLVIGETQIVGQLKNAYNFALQNNSCDKNIENAVKASLKCAAEVRTKTGISKNPISVSSVAVSMAKEKIKNISEETAIVIGAGEMSELACKHLLSLNVKIIILNRSIERAEILAKRLSECGKNVSYDDYSKLQEYINKYSLIFSATGSEEPIIISEMIEPVSFKRYFFDIAVPRDIDIEENVDINVYAVDDLEAIVKKNLLLREEQAQIAYSIVGKSTKEYFKWLRNLSSTPVIKALRNKAEETSEIELEKAINKGYIKNCDKDEARNLIHQIFKAFLHTPTMNLKNLGEEEDIDCVVKSINNVFGIQDRFEKFSEENNCYKMEINNEI